MSFMDRIRGRTSSTKKTDQTQKSAQQKSDRQAHDEFVKRLRAEHPSRPQQSSSLANRVSNKPNGAGSSSDTQRERERVRGQNIPNQNKSKSRDMER